MIKRTAAEIFVAFSWSAALILILLPLLRFCADLLTPIILFMVEG